MNGLSSEHICIQRNGVKRKVGGQMPEDGYGSLLSLNLPREIYRYTESGLGVVPVLPEPLEHVLSSRASDALCEFQGALGGDLRLVVSLVYCLEGL